MKKSASNNSFSKTLLMSSIFLLLFSWACNHDIKTTSFAEMADNAKENVKSITVDDLKECIDNGQELTIIDCRQENDFIEGHIPGAKSIPRGMIGFSDKVTNRRKAVVVYGYDDVFSSLTAKELKKLKFGKVKMLENGWDSWSEQFPEIVETGLDSPAAATKPKVEESGGCGG